ncbi:MAG TPA: PLP-dependent aminotransferase family protein [Caulobacteraceae bacterium]|nr:PLP-dependent aminotransferase family protein [Caulobacteraceae bacterium]
MTRARTDFSLPIALEPGASPLYRQVYDWVQRAIVDGRLKPGQRVPSTRRLAAELRVSRVPILTAFEQLHAEGYLESTIGAGTRVAASMPEQALRSLPRRRPAEACGPRRVSQQAAEALSQPDQLGPPSTLGAFRVSLPALDAFPAKLWASLLARHARRAAPDLMDYSDPMGHLPFREALAEYLGAARGVRCEAAQVMVVSGSQQGLQLAASALLDPGDAVWIEEPGYPGAQRAFAAVGAELVPLPTDAQGLDVAAGVLRRPDARAAYVTPAHQYPLGVTMSASRRVSLLNWAAAANAWIFEDDYDSEFRFESRPFASLQGVDEGHRVIYFGTLSKVLFPGLRIGYVVVPTDLVDAFRAVRTAMDIFPSALFQAALADFFREGHFARHIRRMRLLYMNRATRLADAIQRACGGRLELAGPPAGMHLSVYLPPGVDDASVARRALRQGVTVLPLSAFHLAQPSRPGLVLGFGDADEAAIDRGVEVLAQVLRDPASG